jgi:hypothetical protein
LLGTSGVVSAAGGFVLTAFGRFNGGTIRGDKELADRFLGMFVRI